MDVSCYLKSSHFTNLAGEKFGTKSSQGLVQWMSQYAPKKLNYAKKNKRRRVRNMTFTLLFASAELLLNLAVSVCKRPSPEVAPGDDDCSPCGVFATCSPQWNHLICQSSAPASQVLLKSTQSWIHFCEILIHYIRS